MLKPQDVKLVAAPEGLTMMEELFDLQTKLVALYCEQGKQPAHPLELTEKANQKFIREIISFLEEEIFEGYEVLEKLTKEHSDLKPQEIMAKIEEYNIEQSDAMHLFIELFMYVNIQVEDLKAYYEKYFTQTQRAGLIEDDVLQMAFSHAITVDYLVQMRQRASFKIAHPRDDLSTGGTKVSATSLGQSMEALFECLKYLKLSTNQLKNKYWKDSVTGVNIELFFDYIMESWLHYVLYLQINGFTAESVRQTYVRKNTVNLERIKNKY